MTFENSKLGFISCPTPWAYADTLPMTPLTRNPNYKPNKKTVPIEEIEWKEKQENMPAYCEDPFWQVKLPMQPKLAKMADIFWSPQDGSLTRGIKNV